MAIIIELVKFLLKPIWERFVAPDPIKKEKQERRCREALERIKNERRNFEHIAAGKGYSGKDHRRAVEEYSFELLLITIIKLQKIRKFRKISKTLIGKIENKDASGVLDEINKLEPQLEKFIDD